MPELVLEKLRALQEADRELRRLQAQKDLHDRTLRVRAAQIAKIDEQIEELRTRQKKVRVAADQKDLDVREKKGQIERLKSQQLQVKDNRQYAALQNEIKFAELAISKAEDETLADFEDIEALGAQIADFKRQAEAQRVELDQFGAQIEAHKEAVDAEIQACRRRREGIEAELPPDVVARFHRTADKWDGEAMAAVVRDDEESSFSCGGCNMSVTQNTYVQLLGRSAERLITCPNCSRILYVEDG